MVGSVSVPCLHFNACCLGVRVEIPNLFWLELIAAPADVIVVGVVGIEGVLTASAVAAIVVVFSIRVATAVFVIRVAVTVAAILMAI